MKVFTIVLLSTLLPLLACPQWSADPLQNTPVGVATGEQGLPKVAVHPSGTVYVSWISQENGNYNVRLQKFDTFGNKLWAGQGLLISNHPSMTWYTDWDMKVDYDECAILVFMDIRNVENNIYAYRISPQGAFLWGPNGIALSNNSDFEASPVVTITNQNNAVFAWSRQATNSEFIMLQKVSPAGQKLWGENGIQFQGPQNYTWPVIIPANADDVLMTFFKQTGVFWAPTKNVFVQRFNLNGQPMWGDGIAISNNAGIPAYVVAGMTVDGNNGAYITWHRDNGAWFDAYIQHVAFNGQLTFPANGLALSLSPSSHQIDPLIMPDLGSGNVYAFWREHGFNQNTRGISAQKISPDGQRLWGNIGKTVVPMLSGERAGLNIAMEGSNPVVTFYESPAFSNNSFVKAIKLDADGNTLWPAGHADMSLVESNKLHFHATDFVNNQMIVVWRDERSDGGDVYAQNILADGSLGPFVPEPTLTVYPEILYFHDVHAIVEGLDFITKNEFPEVIVIDSMTIEGYIESGLGYNYYWIVFSESGMTFPKNIWPGDSAVFNVSFPVIPTGRSYLYDTVFLWSGDHEYRVLIELDPAAFPSGVEEVPAANLLSVFPNPFYEQLFISIPEYSDVPDRAEITNPAGQIIFVVEPSVFRNHNLIAWNGRSSSGNTVQPGVYFLRMNFGKRTEVLRILKF